MRDKSKDLYKHKNVRKTRRIYQYILFRMKTEHNFKNLSIRPKSTEKSAKIHCLSTPFTTHITKK